MNNLNDTLPDLMRRATEDLEPESTDLVERGMRRGAVLRRRRTALLSLSGAGAVLATAGIIVGGSALFAGAGGDAPVAGTTNPATPTASVKPTPIPTAGPKAVTSEMTLRTLKSLLPKGLKQSGPYSWGSDREGYLGAGVVVNDGKGASAVVVFLSREGGTKSCSSRGEEVDRCEVRPDGSILTWKKNAVTNPLNPDKPRIDNGILQNTVELTYPDGRVVSLTNYNGPAEKGFKESRPKPLFTVEQLTPMATNKGWKFPTGTPVKAATSKNK